MRREFSLAYLSVIGTSPHKMIDIATATGYDHVSLRVTQVTPDEQVAPLLGDARACADVRAYASNAGVGILDVELARLGPGQQADEHAAVMECAGLLGARFVLAQLPDHDRRRATANFAALCDLAAPYDLTVGLEFIPWSPTPDLAAAVEIVSGADRTNGGVVIDTLHFGRSTSTVDQLRVLPDSLFPFVQLCDAPRYTPYTGDGMIHTAREARYFPGQAGLDLRPMVNALPNVPYSLEIPNEQMRADIGTEEFARRALTESRRFFAQAGTVEAL